ncbi:unnamed protein product [Ectocarpus sp. 12 AP-2014]
MHFAALKPDTGTIQRTERLGFQCVRTRKHRHYNIGHPAHYSIRPALHRAHYYCFAVPPDHVHPASVALPPCCKEMVYTVVYDVPRRCVHFTSPPLRRVDVHTILVLANPPILCSRQCRTPSA